MALKKIFIICLLLFSLSIEQGNAEARKILRDNIVKAQKGDYIVTNQGKMNTLLHVYAVAPHEMIMEEITIPSCRYPDQRLSWREWAESGAPGHTGWVMYELNTDTGAMNKAFSFTKNAWFEIPKADNFLSNLLNLNFTYIPPQERKMVGPRNNSGSIARERRRIWQPIMIANGTVVPNVEFNAWKSRWPNDGSELAGKWIEVYIPENEGIYPSYFPYWLQISGMIGKAKIRIVDSGTGLLSPRPNVFSVGH